MECARLRDCGREDLASLVTHVAVVEGDGAGYDIRSYHEDGTPKFIEVKTTRGAASAAFFVTPNEISFSEQHADQYCLIRVFAYDDATDSACFFEVSGALSAAFALVATEFRATLAAPDGD